MIDPPLPARLEERAVGALLGAAVGDALGAPFEFLAEREVLARVGPEGPRTFHAAYGRIGAITDETQTLLATAEGLLREAARRRVRGVGAPVLFVRDALARWCLLQGEDVAGGPKGGGAWLTDQPEMAARRSPDPVTLRVLAAGAVGSVESPPNEDDGSGALVRSAAAAFALEDPFDLAREIAALTHGHPAAWHAAGALALLLRAIAFEGVEPARAVADAARRVADVEDEPRVAPALLEAQAMAEAGEPLSSGLRALGEGWKADEALAIGVFCALAEGDFARAVAAAAAHGGDTDATAAVTGLLAGVARGVGAVPLPWRRAVEGGPLVEQVARDLLALALYGPEAVDTERYPPE